jgi:hypothetical protein
VPVTRAKTPQDGLLKWLARQSVEAPLRLVKDLLNDGLDARMVEAVRISSSVSPFRNSLRA